MKIRIKGNTIRYRLVKTEVKQLADLGYVEEETVFTNASFKYRLESKSGISELQAHFIENKITLFIPDFEAKKWHESDRITFKNQFENLSLLLEKDFVCLDHSDEDQSDNYTNPNKSC